jgi:CRISPR/Cas system endoribonuclease Cas6 (RAMP superfamily)
MTKFNIKKISMLAAITATIITLAVLSPTITEDILATQTDSVTKVELNMKLANAHQLLRQNGKKKHN